MPRPDIHISTAGRSASIRRGERYYSFFFALNVPLTSKGFTLVHGEYDIPELTAATG
jgi:hypothetical protein